MAAFFISFIMWSKIVGESATFLTWLSFQKSMLQPVLWSGFLQSQYTSCRYITRGPGILKIKAAGYAIHIQ